MIGDGLIAMNTSKCPDKIYKYLSFEGMCKTLENQTIRLSKPSSFNDPLDMYLQEALGQEMTHFCEDLKIAFCDFISGEIDISQLQGSHKAEIELINSTLKNLQPEQKKPTFQELIKTPIEELYDIKLLEQINRESVSFIQRNFEMSGIFCSTIDFKNLLMWAHYADQHKGGVLEFTPSKGKDSAFLVSQKVVYSDKRPVLFETAKHLMRGLTTQQEERNKLFYDSLVFTKSREWEYEQEYRLCIPKFIEEGKDFATNAYHSEELTSVFLGCRMNVQNRDRIIKLAKGINPKATIYKASIMPRAFALDFEKIS
jgi:hypothetical protein